MTTRTSLLLATLSAALYLSPAAKAEVAQSTMDGFGRFAVPSAVGSTPAAPIRQEARDAAKGRIGTAPGLTLGISADPAGGHALAYQAYRWQHVDRLPHDTPRPSQRSAGQIAEIYGTSP